MPIVNRNRPLILCISKNQTVNKFKIGLYKKLSPFFKIFEKKTDGELEKLICSKVQSQDIPFSLMMVCNPSRCQFCPKHHPGNCEMSFQNEVKINDLIMKAGKKRFILSIEIKSIEKTQHISKLEAIEKSKDEFKRKNITIYDCFDYFSRDEQLDEKNLWECEKCKKKVRGIKSAGICELPNILVIHLKRFKQKMMYKSAVSKKIQDLVEFPIEGFDLEKYYNGDTKASTKYNLFAVTYHFGETSGGHYIAICKNPIYDSWIEFDDKSMHNSKEKDVVSKYGYVLYYRKVEYLLAH